MDIQHNSGAGSGAPPAKSLRDKLRSSDPAERKAAQVEMTRRSIEARRAKREAQQAARAAEAADAVAPPVEPRASERGASEQALQASGTILARSGADGAAGPMVQWSGGPTSEAGLARSVLDLTPEQRRELALVALDELKAQLVATSRVARMSRGRVVGHDEVPDNPARFKAADRILKLVAADIPADRTPGAPAVIVIQTPSWLGPQPEVIDVTPRDATLLTLPA